MKLGAIDEVALDVSGTVLERLDAEAAPVEEDEADDGEALAAGPIAIAVDLNEPEGASGDNPAS